MPVYKTKTEKTKDNKIWYFKCNYRDVYGNIKQKKSKKFATKDEAVKEEAKFLLNCNSMQKASEKTVYDLYNYYFFLDNKVTNKESSLYTKESRIRKYVLPFFYNEKIDKYDSISELTKLEKIKNWKLWLNKKDLSLSTKKAIFNSFSSIIEYGINNLNIEYNILKIVENFKERNDDVVEKEKVRFLTNEEYNLFISELDDFEFKVIFHFLYEVGCRKGEMQALMWNDINFNKDQVRINKTLSAKNINGGIKITNTKNRKIRYIDISYKLKDELKVLYNKMKILDGFNNNWFVFGGLKYISSTTLKRKKDETINRLIKKNINIPHITIHEFRHSSASYMISNGISIEIIAYRLGDTVETVRNVYAHLFPDTQKEAKGLFDTL